MPREKRKAEREELPIAFAYFYKVKDYTQFEKSFAINISNIGISFYSVEPLKKGTEVAIYSDYFLKNPKKARIVWSKRIIGSTWRIGAQFI
jgi:hypothetical protein